MANFNKIPEIDAELEKLNHAELVIGVPTDNGFLQMIARVNEYGMTIKPKNGEYLAVPDGKGGIRKLKEVHIPPRAWLRWSVDHYKQEWSHYALQLITGIMFKGKSADYVLDNLGKRITLDLQKTIRQWNDPPNAQLTIDSKGFNNPLVDTGKLHDSITYEKKEDL